MTHDAPTLSQAVHLAPPPIAEARLFLRGAVEHGDQRGRQLGFPTANIAIDERTIAPPEGVYAGYAYRTNGTIHKAAVSVGRRPTFYTERGMRLLEAHLLEFDGDLYGEVILVELVARLRDQVRFDSVDDLAAQLGVDIQRCRDALSAVPPSAV